MENPKNSKFTLLNNHEHLILFNYWIPEFLTIKHFYYIYEKIGHC